MKGVDFFKAKMFHFLLNEISDLTDYEDEEIVIDDEKVADSNSNIKKKIFHGFLRLHTNLTMSKFWKRVINLNVKLVAIIYRFLALRAETENLKIN